MKKLIFALALSFAFCIMSHAVPAYPWPVKYRQPDGSVVTIQLHGDENYHYATMNGIVVARGSDGFYRRASLPVRKSHVTKASMVRPVLRTNNGVKKAIGMGQNKFLVILVEYADLQFTVENPREAFYAMLNERGYSQNGGTGSVYDYYYDNSTHQFDPTFDVIGPVKVSKGYAEYGKNHTEDDDDDPENDGQDMDPAGLFSEACRIAHDQGLVNYADYDNDHDGYVDNIFFYYAGHNEAEHGGEDTIWPHASGLNPRENAYDGVKIYSYACSSEYKGAPSSSGTPPTMAGIGTFCHEFGHVLGLPDFYDTDYEKNGSASNVYAFSLMCSGNYNNNGRTPPYLSIMERYQLGWADIPVWEESGHKTLGPVYQNNGAMTPSSTDGEFFLYEVRDGTGWDAYIKAYSSNPVVNGMLVYHVDMSNNPVGETTAIRLWYSNDINIYAEHPCYYMVLPKQSYNNYNDMLYPGTTGTTTFEGTDWAKLKTRYVLSNITYSNGTVDLDLEVPGSLLLKGKAVDSSGNPLEGVKVEVSLADDPAVQSLKERTFISLKDLKKTAKYSTQTGSDGTYEVEIPGLGAKTLDIVFSKDMFNSEHFQITTSGGAALQNVVMYNYSEGKPATLSKNSGASGYAIGFSQQAETYSATLAVLYYSSELEPYNGYNVENISFMMKGSGEAPAQVDVFVDFDNERVLTKTVTAPVYNRVQTIDVSDAGITIPSGKNVYIGYAVKDIKEQYWMAIDGENGVDGGGMVRGGFVTTGGVPQEWQAVGYNFIINTGLTQIVSPFSGLGIRVISKSADGKYANGSTFPLTFVDGSVGGTPTSVAWYYDGQPVSGEAITLSASGTHTVKAVVTYPDGNIEEIEQVIEVL